MALARLWVPPLVIRQQPIIQGKRGEDHPRGPAGVDAHPELDAHPVEQGAHLVGLEELVDHHLGGLGAVLGGDAPVAVPLLDQRGLTLVHAVEGR